MSNPLLTTVATEVAGEFGSRLSAILAPTRGQPADALARAVAMHVYQRVAPAGRRSGLNFTEVGRDFGRDRTTVRAALTRVEGLQESVPGFSKRVSRVIRNVRSRL